MGYDGFEVGKMLRRMTVVVDTREQDTPALHERLAAFSCPVLRRKLDYGDYSAETVSGSGEVVSLERVAVVERKMSLDELCLCFTKGRERFAREFERAAADHAKVHMIVENGSYEALFGGAYRSRMHPDSLIASYLAWSARYRIGLHFCEPRTTGKLIYKLLYYELKTYLEGGDALGTGLDQAGA